jgi:hypothetical protein
MGLYVESISDSPSTAAAEFDNFTAAQLSLAASLLWMW